MKWKPDWAEARANLIRWWRGEGMALSLTCPRAEPVEPVPAPDRPEGIVERWTDPAYVCSAGEYKLARTHYFAEAFPYLSTDIGPGSLGTFLGAVPEFDERTVWYRPCIDEAEGSGPIRLDPGRSEWWRIHLAIVAEAAGRAGGRYLVGMPDLIENLDTLAAMRGTERLMADLIDRPEWVCRKVAEINEAFFGAFGLLYERIRDEEGGSVFGAFGVWGPGKTAKVQCDLSCMISPEMFERFVVPALTRQCQWLDCSIYHLDGQDALGHLDSLLAIGPLDAIEWTPIGAFAADPGRPDGGSPEWYDLYRRIKAAGKSVQAIHVRVEEVVPLLEAVGPEGMRVVVDAPDPLAAEALLGDVEQFR